MDKSDKLSFLLHFGATSACWKGEKRRQAFNSEALWSNKTDRSQQKLNSVRGRNLLDRYFQYLWKRLAKKKERFQLELCAEVTEEN